MLVHWKSVLAAALVAGGIAAAPSAEAGPLGPVLAGSLAGAPPAASEVAYVCGPWGCGWRPGPRWGGYGYYGPRPVYGWGPRCWVRPTPWGPRQVCRGW